MPRVFGVFNLFWNTFGGGESHALGVALKLLNPHDEAYLISESDFNIDELEKRFGLELSSFRKLIIPNFSQKHTKEFDVFINATFGSNLVSEARESLYIVSFPHKGMPQSVISSYFFLYNSEYTKSWAQRYWPNADGVVVYPTFGLYCPEENEIADKQPIIVSIGRITRGGHAKNQHLIIEAFKATRHLLGGESWSLYVIGGLDNSRQEDVEYYKYLIDISLSDCRIHVIANCPRDRLQKIMRSARIYVHATGIGAAPTEPEKQEHFGITVLEAALVGAYPIAFDNGGPKELIGNIGHGRTYKSHVELERILVELLSGSLEQGTSEVILAAKAFCQANERMIISLR